MSEELVKWKKYPSMDSILKEKPERLAPILGQNLYWEIKRDGSNISLMRKTDDGPILIYSRNTQIIDKHLEERVKNTLAPIWDKINDALYYAGNKIILYGEFIHKGKSPAGFEYHETPSFVFFDIWSIPDRKFFPPDAKYDFLKIFNLPVVELHKITTANTLDDLFQQRNEIVAEMEKRGLEGVVLKAYGTDNKLHLYKEKTDVRKIVKLHSKDKKKKPTLPPLPLSEIFGAIDKAYWVLGPEKFKDKREALSTISEYIQEEAKKHMCHAPKSVYKQYIEYLNRQEEIRAKYNLKKPE